MAASSTTMLAAFATCVLLANMAAAAIPWGSLPVFVTEHKFVCYQQIYDSNQLLVFPYSYSPPEEVAQGQGYVFNDPCTETASPASGVVATVTGFYVYASNDTEHEMSSINFYDYNVDTSSGSYVNVTLDLTGGFLLTDGEDNDRQELSIISGTKAFAGAEGTLKYTKVYSQYGLETFKVEGSFTIPSPFHH